MKGLPTSLVIWLYNRLNVKDSVWYSLKQDSSFCCVNANNVGARPGGSHYFKNLTSAGDAECSTVMKGWHLHAFGPSAQSDFLWPAPMHIVFHLHSHHEHTSSQGNSSSTSLTMFRQGL